MSCVTYFRSISALGTVSNIHSVNWGKTTKYIYQTFCNLLSYRALAFSFWDTLLFSLHEALPNGLLTVSKVSVVRHREMCPSYREYGYSKMTENDRAQPQLSVLERCPIRKSGLYVPK